LLWGIHRFSPGVGRSSACLRLATMADIDEIDIWRAAEQMRTTYGEDAGIEAAVRADKALYQGDMGGCEVSKRVVEVIGELDRNVPNAGEAVN
jgi:hypothetical protein